MKIKKLFFKKKAVFRTAIVATFFLIFSNILLAIVNDAYSYALEVAIKFKKEGFMLRNQYFITGYIKPGERKAVSHKTLYKGNEYWFWVGFNLDFVEYGKVHIEILDKNKKALNVTKKQFGDLGNVIGARILIPQTDSYYIVFWLEKDASNFNLDKNNQCQWAMTYAQR